ncbi:hypothetical protein F511_22473 [Dorcoceras hygrometricum]|uniref:Dystroglycan-like n=1 Tax=Dorcoceras hygrometricum TaxID=472368 RepID=A0A2Z7BDW5_9LAMI|nr:hypothetical protein F511_22473 [Dorcoceras hygrometricum]
MASSLIRYTVHVLFDSVLAMDHSGVVSMFEALVASGLKGFLGCPAVIYEAALIEFFRHGSFMDGMVVSTIQGKTVDISEEVFAGSFELPMDGLTDLNEVPKDLVFDARSIFSFTGELVSTSCKNREMKIEFRLLSDILEKSIFVKAGLFDAVTHERFLMMAAIDGGVKINWGILLFNIFKDMVTAESRQARGFAIQISILLQNIPNLELCGAASDSRVKKTPTKKAVSKKRPAAAVDEPIAKKNRTTVGKATKSSALVPVAQEAIPLQIVEPIRAVPAVLPSKPKRKAPKRRLQFPAGSDDDIFAEETAVGGIAEKDSMPAEADVVDKGISTADDVDTIIEQVIAETAQMDTDVEGTNVSIPDVGVQMETGPDDYFVEEPSEETELIQGTEIADVVPTTDEKRNDDESMSLE